MKCVSKVSKNSLCCGISLKSEDDIVTFSFKQKIKNCVSSRYAVTRNVRQVSQRMEMIYRKKGIAYKTLPHVMSGDIAE